MVKHPSKLMDEHYRFTHGSTDEEAADRRTERQTGRQAGRQAESNLLLNLHHGSTVVADPHSRVDSRLQGPFA